MHGIFNILSKALDKTGLFGTVEVEHKKVHDGISYSAEYIQEDVSNGAKRYIHITAGDKPAHIHIQLDVLGKHILKTYTNATYTNVGTASDGVVLTQFNRIINSADTGTAIVRHNPTIDNIGALRAIYIAQGGAGGQAIGESANSNVETILPAGHDYLIEIENASGQARDIDFSINWYEVG